MRYFHQVYFVYKYSVKCHTSPSAQNKERWGSLGRSVLPSLYDYLWFRESWVQVVVKQVHVMYSSLKKRKEVVTQNLKISVHKKSASATADKVETLTKTLGCQEHVAWIAYEDKLAFKRQLVYFCQETVLVLFLMSRQHFRHITAVHVITVTATSIPAKGLDIGRKLDNCVCAVQGQYGQAFLHY